MTTNTINLCCPNPKSEDKLRKIYFYVDSVSRFCLIIVDYEVYFTDIYANGRYIVSYLFLFPKAYNDEESKIYHAKTTVIFQGNYYKTYFSMYHSSKFHSYNVFSSYNVFLHVNKQTDLFTVRYSVFILNGYITVI